MTKTTKQTTLLAIALEERGIRVKLEHWDGHKHVDIFIPAVGMYIEVDGMPHYTSPKQIIQDLQRDHFSNDDGFFTKHIPNELIETHLKEIADAIETVVKERGILAKHHESSVQARTDS